MRYVTPPSLTILPSLSEIEASCTPQTRTIVGPLLAQIEAAYATYEASRPDTLHELSPIGLSSDQRDQLHIVFKRRQGRFREVWQGLNSHFTSTKESTCPYCNFVEQWEHDHYLPRKVFPEFTLYPNNLIPICKHCNGKKLAYYKQNGRRIFKHLFTELNNVSGFLHAKISYAPKLSVEYELRQVPALSDEQYEVLCLHVDRLDLVDRYARQASTVLAKLVRQFRTPMSLGLGQDLLQQRLTQMAVDRAVSMPPNHWEVALLETLAATDEFADHIFS